MLIKTLELGKKLTVGLNTVDDADRVVGVIRHTQVMTQFFDGFHVPRCNVTSSTDKSEVFHVVVRLMGMG